MRTCIICDKQATHVQTFDIDVKGLGSCKDHKNDVYHAYVVLVTIGGDEYIKFLRGLRNKYKKGKI